MTVPGTERCITRETNHESHCLRHTRIHATILLEAWVARRRWAVHDIPDAITSLHHGLLEPVTNAFTKIATLGIYIAVYEAYRFYRMVQRAVFRCGFWPRAVRPVLLLGAPHGPRGQCHVGLACGAPPRSTTTCLPHCGQTSTGALFGWVFYLPLAVLGIPWQMLVIVGLIDLLYQYWVHTELIGRLGILDRILVTPSNHRVHHGQNDYCIDKNYGGIPVLWDRLFGTFADERDDEKICYGIRKPLHSFSPIKGNLHYYADLWQMSRAAKGWRAKLVSGWRHRAAGPTNPSNISSPAPLPALMCKPRAAALVRGAAVRGAGAFVSHFIGGPTGLTEARPRVRAGHSGHGGGALGRCLSVLSGASGWSRCVRWRWVRVVRRRAAVVWL